MARRSQRAEREALRGELTASGCTTAQVAEEFTRQFGARSRLAWRWAAGWTQWKLVQEFRIANPAFPISESRISEWEAWPHGGTQPSLDALGALAATFGCSVADLLDLADQAAMTADQRSRVRAATSAGASRLDAVSGGVAATSALSSSPGSQSDVLGLLDAARPLVDDTLAATTMSAGRLELIEERIAEHLVSYTCAPPATMLAVLGSDIVEIQEIAAVRQPAMVQAKLSEAQAILALLTADAMMKLGEIRRSRCWYGTARLAADDTGNPHLQARVRAQEAMLPYYYGPVEQAVELAHTAQSLLPDVASETTALAAAAEARALARLGDADGAERAMSIAQRYVDQADSLGSPDAAFHFNHKRLLLYLSGTLTYLDQPARAQRVQEEALRLYSAQPDLVVDPALIRLDQAVSLALSGQADESCQLAVDVITNLPTEYRTRVVLAKTDDVVRALPTSAPHRPRTELTELITTHTRGNP